MSWPWPVHSGQTMPPEVELPHWKPHQLAGVWRFPLPDHPFVSHTRTPFQEDRP